MALVSVPPIAIGPRETAVTCISPPSIEPVKDADPGAIELPVVVATVGWAAFNWDWRRPAALAKLVAPARLIDASKV